MLCFPNSAKLESILKPFNNQDLSPLKNGYVLVNGIPGIGAKLEFELRRTYSAEGEGSETRGLLNWIPIYNEHS